MTQTDLLILVPWVIFAGGVATIMIMLINRDARSGRQPRRRSRPRRR